MSKSRVNTLHFGWSWQVWDENSYPGRLWKFWMKCCPRCWAGPLTKYEDEYYELCPKCEVFLGGHAWRVPGGRPRPVKE